MGRRATAGVPGGDPRLRRRGVATHRTRGDDALDAPAIGSGGRRAVEFRAGCGRRRRRPLRALRSRRQRAALVVARLDASPIARARWRWRWTFVSSTIRSAGCSRSATTRARRSTRRLRVRPARVRVATGELRRHRRRRRAGRNTGSVSDARSRSSTARRRSCRGAAAMFEYLMPTLVMPLARRSRCSTRRVTRRCTGRSRSGRTRGVPWGISESAYNVRDRHDTYQYRAFGVPDLALKRGLAERSRDRARTRRRSRSPSIAHEAMENLASLERRGALGAYGFYDALDYTRPDAGERCRDGAHVHGASHRHEPRRAGQRAEHRQGRARRTVAATVHGRPRRSRRGAAARRARSRDGTCRDRRSRMPRPCHERVGADAHRGARGRHAAHAGATRRAARRQRLQRAAHERRERPQPRERHRRAVAGAPTPRRTTPANGSTSRISPATRVVRGIPADARDAGVVSRHVRGRSRHLHATRRRGRDANRDRRRRAERAGGDPARDARQPLGRHARARADELRRGRARVPPAADRAHPAFQKLVRRDGMGAGQAALLASRRPRSAGERGRWCVHAVAVGRRARRRGDVRDRSRAVPRDVAAPCTRRARSIADVLAVGNRRRGARSDRRAARAVRVEPGPFGDGGVHDRGRADARGSTATRRIGTATPGAADRALSASRATEAEVELRDLDIAPADVALYQELAGALIYPHEALRAPERSAWRESNRRRLWAQGISGDLADRARDDPRPSGSPERSPTAGDAQVLADEGCDAATS